MVKFSDDEKLINRVRDHFNKGIVKYRLIDDGDVILVGLSGGKDSLALLELLALRSRIFKPHFTVKAVHVRMTNIPYIPDFDYLQSFADSLGVSFQVYETCFDPSTDTRKSPCFLCSWNRRKALFQAAKELGCNKIALGHHMDDFLETMLMNMTFQGAFSSMPPMLKMRKFEMSVIRPMCLVHEKDLVEMARIRGFRQMLKNCPYEETSNRSQIKRVLAELEVLNPEARYSLWGSMSNVQEELLPGKIEK